MANAVEGPENSGQAANRPPVRLAVTNRTTMPTVGDGQVVELQGDTRGGMWIVLKDRDGASNSAAKVQASGDGDSAGFAGLYAYARAIIYNGGTWDRLRTSAIFKSFASTAITAGVGATIWTPGAGKKFRLMGWLISTSAAGQLIFGDNLVGTVIARSEAAAAAGVSNPVDFGNGILSAAANNVLKLDGPTGNVAGMVWGTEE